MSKYFPSTEPAPVPPTTPMPASIVKAISAIKATVHAVRKSQKNQHGGYMFASTDDIYAAVANKMGEVGYHVHGLEQKCDIVRLEKDGKTVQWLNAVYSFMHMTETDTWSHPDDKRTLYIQITGPQTFQAAQSYAEKAYLRSLFKLPTGDMDLDSMPQGDTEEDQAALSSTGKRKSSSASKKDGTDIVFNEINRHIQGAGDAEGLRYIRTSYAKEWSTMPARWLDLLDQAYDDRMQEFGELAPAE